MRVVFDVNILTLDDDLLCLEQIESCRIVTPDEFEAVLHDL